MPDDPPRSSTYPTPFGSTSFQEDMNQWTAYIRQALGLAPRENPASEIPLEAIRPRGEPIPRLIDVEVARSEDVLRHVRRVSEGLFGRTLDGSPLWVNPEGEATRTPQSTSSEPRVGMILDGLGPTFQNVYASSTPPATAEEIAEAVRASLRQVVAEGRMIGSPATAESVEVRIGQPGPMMSYGTSTTLLGTGSHRGTDTSQVVIGMPAPFGQGDISFRTGDREALRFSPDGVISIEGRVLATDKEIVGGIRRFLQKGGYLPQDPIVPGEGHDRFERVLEDEET